MVDWLEPALWAINIALWLFSGYNLVKTLYDWQDEKRHGKKCYKDGTRMIDGECLTCNERCMCTCLRRWHNPGSVCYNCLTCEEFVSSFEESYKAAVAYLGEDYFA